MGSAPNAIICTAILVYAVIAPAVTAPGSTISGALNYTCTTLPYSYFSSPPYTHIPGTISTSSSHKYYPHNTASCTDYTSLYFALSTAIPFLLPYLSPLLPCFKGRCRSRGGSRSYGVSRYPDTSEKGGGVRQRA